MTLKEAIEHAEDTAKSAIGCECRDEHRQLAEWLRELAERREKPEIIHCGECAFPYIRGKNMYCDQITGEEIMVWKDEYCSWGEKKHVENG